MIQAPAEKDKDFGNIDPSPEGDPELKDDSKTNDAALSQKKYQGGGRWFQRFVAWFCGVSDLEENLQYESEDDKDREIRHMDKIIEQPLNRLILSVALGLIACAYLFLYIYYA